MAQGVYEVGVYEVGVYEAGEVIVSPGPPPEPGLVSVTLVFAGPDSTGGATPFGTPNLLER